MGEHHPCPCDVLFGKYEARCILHGWRIRDAAKAPGDSVTAQHTRAMADAVRREQDEVRVDGPGLEELRERFAGWSCPEVSGTMLRPHTAIKRPIAGLLSVKP